MHSKFWQDPLWGKRELVYKVEPELLEMELYVASMEFRAGDALLRYVPVATRFDNTTLESINTNDDCTGLTGAEVWGQCAELVESLAGED